MTEKLLELPGMPVVKYRARSSCRLKTRYLMSRSCTNKMNLCTVLGVFKWRHLYNMVFIQKTVYFCMHYGTNCKILINL